MLKIISEVGASCMVCPFRRPCTRTFNGLRDARQRHGIARTLKPLDRTACRNRNDFAFHDPVLRSARLVAESHDLHAFFSPFPERYQRAGGGDKGGVWPGADCVSF
jgi:hypothetical protein